MRNPEKFGQPNHYPVPPHQYSVKIPNGLFPNCVNCLDDAYDIDQTSYIYKTKFGSLPQWISSLNNAHIRKEKMISIKSKQYRFKVVKCRLGNDHIIGSRGKPFPMIKQMYNLLEKAHSSNHYSLETIQTILDAEPNFEKFGINRFYYIFIKNCKKCREKGLNSSLQRPTKITYLQDIDQKLKQIPISKKILSQRPKKQQLEWNFETCPYNCEEDVYESKYIGYVPFFLYGYKPIELQNEKYKKFSRKKYVTAKCQNHTIGVIRCEKGTSHLWKLVEGQNEIINKSQQQLADEGYERIAMKNEKVEIMRKIHDHFGHLSAAAMKIQLRKSPFLSPPFYKDLIDIQFCEQCKKQREVNPKKVIGKDQHIVLNPEQKSCYEYLKFKMLNGRQDQPLKRNITSKQLIELQKCGIRCRSWNYSTYIFTTEEMIKKYRQFGQCLFLSQIIGLSCLKKIFFITGISNYGFPTLFAIIIIEDILFKSFFEAFSMFFELMKYHPKSIYIPDNSQIFSALSTCIYSKISDSSAQNLKILRYFESQIENIFCSVSFLEHYAENMKYKMKFLEQYSYSLFIFDFVKDLKRVDHVMSGFLLSISQKQMSHSFKSEDTELFKCTPEIYNKLKSQIFKSKQLKSEKIDTLKQKVYDLQNKINLTYSLTKSCWICSCQRIYKDGLPCIHLIHVVRKYKGHIFYYINTRWVL